MKTPKSYNHIEESSAGQKFGRLPLSDFVDRAFVEKMPWNKQLHPEFWDNESMKLYGATASELRLMANQFIRVAKIPKDQIADIIFKGSLATYNYTPTSDVDIQIILKYDWDKNPLRDPADRTGAKLQGEFDKARADYNKEHGFTLGKKKYPVEFFIQTPRTNRATGASARWSLMKGDWLPGYKPAAAKPGTAPKEIDRYFKEYYARIKQTYLDKIRLHRLEAAVAARKALGTLSGTEREEALHINASLDADVSNPRNLAFKALKRTKLVAFVETEIEKAKRNGLMALKQKLDAAARPQRRNV